MKEKPTYYAIIPAPVRYSEVTANAKLLYGEITALSSKEGYCFATNNYFAKLYGKTKNTVSRWIGELADNGFIKVDLIYDKETRQVKERHIRINHPVNINKDTPPHKNDGRGAHKNDEDITTSNSTTRYNINNLPEKPSLETRLKHAFISRLTDKTIYNDDKERKAIKSLIKKASQHEDEEAFLHRLLGTFEGLRKKGNTFWQGQPFLPSVLNSSGIYSRVVEQMAKPTAAEEAMDLLKEAKERYG